jgi:hypothetical protein
VNRREFIAALGSAAAWPVVARGQQSRQVRRVGVVMSGAENDSEQAKQTSAFREGMRKLGWLEGKNLVLEFRWQAGGPERAQAAISELINLPVDVILVGTIQAFLALRRSSSNIPAVFVTRDELDLKQRLWSLPGARTKNGYAHSIPLSDMAIEVINEAPDLFGPLYPGYAGKIIASHDYFGLAHWTAHDLRRTALTGMAKLGVAPLVLGHIANHRTTTKAGMTLSVYAHCNYAKEKREALELWADRLRGIIVGGAEIVPIGRSA